MKARVSDRLSDLLNKVMPRTLLDDSIHDEASRR